VPNDREHVNLKTNTQKAMLYKHELSHSTFRKKETAIRNRTANAHEPILPGDSIYYGTKRSLENKLTNVFKSIKRGPGV